MKVCLHVCACLSLLQPCVCVCVCARTCVFKGVSGASMSATKRLNTLCVHLRVCVCVPVLCVQLMNLSLKAVSLLLCLPCYYNYKGHLTLKPSQFESPFAHMASVSPLAK